MARLPNFLVIIRSEKLSGKGQGRGAKKRTFRFGKKNVSFPKVETFRFADYNLLKPIDKKELEGIIDRFMKKEEESAAASLAIPARVHSVGEHTFMISTPTNDLRILRSIDIGFFRYNSDRKLWEVVLNNQLPLLLKKNTTADHIKGYDPCFVQIHQSYIININYLMMIKENRCVMFPPFENITELQVSKKFRKELQDRFYLL